MSRKRKNCEEPESSQNKKSIGDELIKIWVSQVLDKILASSGEGEIGLKFPLVVFMLFMCFV